MLSVFAIALWRRRDSRPADVLASAAACVLLWNPASIVAAGFWLSFAAVAVIFFTLAGRPLRSGRVAGAVRVQLAIFAGLAPVALLGDHLVVGDLDGYVHWLSADDGRILGRTRVGSGAISVA